MDVRDFVDMVNGKLAWESEVNEAKLDIMFEQQSHFTANIMLSSGNYKKSIKLEKIKESLYIPIADRAKHAQRQHGKPVRTEGRSSQKKIDELKQKFNIEDEGEG